MIGTATTTFAGGISLRLNDYGAGYFVDATADGRRMGEVEQREVNAYLRPGQPGTRRFWAFRPTWVPMPTVPNVENFETREVLPGTAWHGEHRTRRAALDALVAEVLGRENSRS